MRSMKVIAVPADTVQRVWDVGEDAGGPLLLSRRVGMMCPPNNIIRTHTDTGTTSGSPPSVQSFVSTKDQIIWKYF